MTLKNSAVSEKRTFDLVSIWPLYLWPHGDQIIYNPCSDWSLDCLDYINLYLSSGHCNISFCVTATEINNDFFYYRNITLYDNFISTTLNSPLLKPLSEEDMIKIVCKKPKVNRLLLLKQLKFYNLSYFQISSHFLINC